MALQDAKETDSQNKPESTAFNPTQLANLPEGAATPVDVKDDPWHTGRPPRGWFLAKLYPAQNDPYTTGLREKGKPETVWYMTNNELKIQNKDDEFYGASLFARLSTFLGFGKSISTMAAVIARTKWAKHLQTEMTPRALVDLFIKVQKKEPAFWVLVDWRGWSTEDKKAVFPTYETFPDSPNGKGKMHMVTRTAKTGITEQIQARAEIVAWRAQDDPPSEEERKGVASKVTAPLDDLDMEDIGGTTGGSKPLTKSSGDDLDEVETEKPKKGEAKAPKVADPDDLDSLVD